MLISVNNYVIKITQFLKYKQIMGNLEVSGESRIMQRRPIFE